ncbi:protein FAM71B [Biomphalaria pfeifferi]|uniref:Protein FAM71B n=1 Tax=Biomphalaria pfeifferi TaxID=112525 RepID=A0AAD8F1I1_BIOPF|nr:protein FAM71B [Biomphalaria pfeifferi]
MLVTDRTIRVSLACACSGLDLPRSSLSRQGFVEKGEILSKKFPKMVVATVTVVAGVAAIVATGGTAAPIVAAAAEGVVLGATGAATATASGVAVATAAATSAGAVTGAVAVGAAGTAAATATGVVTGAATSAAIAGGTALGVSASGTGAAGLVTAGVAAGPVGWLVLGTEKHIIHKMYTFDCWKPVVHEMSTEPSKGKLLRDVVGDPRVKQTIVKSNEDGQLPEIILQNIWDELFRIDFVMLSSQQLAAHAVRM